MNYVKKCLSCLLAAVMFITAVPAYQTDASTQKNEVTINTGIEEITLNQSDYDENGNFQPNVVKFILNIKNHASDDSINFLSFRLDERYYKDYKV